MPDLFLIGRSSPKNVLTLVGQMLRDRGDISTKEWEAQAKHGHYLAKAALPPPSAQFLAGVVSYVQTARALYAQLK